MRRFRVLILACAALLPAPLAAVTFESGDVSLNISGFLGVEASGVTSLYTPLMKPFYFGPSYSSLNFDFWVGTKFHTRFAFGVRPLFPNLYGASNIQWLPGVEAYGEYIPCRWFKVRLGQLIAPLGYFMPLHLNPTQYPMVGPPVFFEEETLPYSTAAEATISIPLGKTGKAKIPIVLFGGKPLTRTYARTFTGSEPDLSQYYQFGLRFGYEYGRYFKTGYSMQLSESNAMRVYNGYVAFQNDLLYLVVESVSRNWGAMGVSATSASNTGETSIDAVVGVHLGKFTPYINYDNMWVYTQSRLYNVFGAGVDIDLSDNFKWKIQADYRMVDYSATATNWNPRAFTLRSSLLFYFR